jgi:hypothetical protein
MTDEALVRQVSKPPRPSIVVAADDGTELLRIRVTEDGMLDVTGAEDRWTEGAARFVAEMRRLIAQADGRTRCASSEAAASLMAGDGQ